jgi:hypothetical protein
MCCVFKSLLPFTLIIYFFQLFSIILKIVLGYVIICSPKISVNFFHCCRVLAPLNFLLTIPRLTNALGKGFLLLPIHFFPAR